MEGIERLKRHYINTYKEHAVLRDEGYEYTYVLASQLFNLEMFIIQKIGNKETRELIVKGTNEAQDEYLNEKDNVDSVKYK